MHESAPILHGPSRREAARLSSRALRKPTRASSCVNKARVSSVTSLPPVLMIATALHSHNPRHILRTQVVDPRVGPNLSHNDKERWLSQASTRPDSSDYALVRACKHRHARTTVSLLLPLAVSRAHAHLLQAGDCQAPSQEQTEPLSARDGCGRCCIASPRR